MVRSGLILAALLVTGQVKSLAQEAPVQSQYLFDYSYLNPAFTGLNNCLSVKLTNRHQWLGIANAPATQTLRIEKGIENKNYVKESKYGIGLTLYSDRNGVYRSTGGRLGYAFHGRLTKKRPVQLSLGLSVDVRQYRLDASRLEGINGTSYNGGTSALVPDLQAGLLITSARMYTGLSASRMLPYSTTWYNTTFKDKMPLSLQAIAGYHIRHELLEITPEIVYKLNLNGWQQADANLLLAYRDRLHAGYSYRRSLDQLPGTGLQHSFLAGVDVGRWHISYIYSYLPGNIGSGYGTHELLVAWRKCQSSTRCPAYR